MRSLRGMRRPPRGSRWPSAATSSSASAYRTPPQHAHAPAAAAPPTSSRSRLRGPTSTAAKPGATKPYLPDQASVHRFVATLPIRPTVQMQSGRRPHPGGSSPSRSRSTTAAERAQAEALLRRWHAVLRQRLGGFALDSTHDISRVLRVPGTINSKYGCRVVLEAGGRPARRSERTGGRLRRGAGTPESSSRDEDFEPPAGSARVALDPAADPPADKFAALRRRSPLFDRLWRREIAPKDASQSGYDFRLATLAAAAGWTDDELLALLVAHRRAGGGRPKPASSTTRSRSRKARAASRSPARREAHP